MKQTAVEWLQVQLNENGKLSAVDFYQAKQMEKKQMEDVWHDSRVEDFGDDYIGKQISFNDYYNETFKTKTKNQ